MEYFEYANPQVWGTDRLCEHITDLQETNQIPHNEPRKSIVARQLAHVLFEFAQRIREESAWPLEKTN